MSKDSTEHKGFAGDLNDLSIVELVQMLNLNKKSGELHIVSDVKGSIFLKDGHLWAAQTDEKSGEKAVYDLVARTDGEFSFQVCEVNIPRNIETSTMNVVVEACRIMDETRHNIENSD